MRPILPGDWLACEDAHPNWKCLEAQATGQTVLAENFVNAKGEHPRPNTDIDPCSVCGKPVVVRVGGIIPVTIKPVKIIRDGQALSEV